MATSQRKDIDLGIDRIEHGGAARKQCAVLQIATAKGYSFRGGLRSDAQVFWVSAGSRQCMLGIGDKTGDFHKTVAVSDPKVKATQKAIDKMHTEVFTDEAIAALVIEAKAHYARVVEAGVG